MTTHTTHPSTVSAKTVGIAFAGAVLAGALGWGLAALVLDDPVQVGASLPAPADIGDDLDRYPGFDPNNYAGTDREDRAFQHRN